MDFNKLKPEQLILQQEHTLAYAKSFCKDINYDVEPSNSQNIAQSSRRVLTVYEQSSMLQLTTLHVLNIMAYCSQGASQAHCVLFKNLPVLHDISL